MTTEKAPEVTELVIKCPTIPQPASVEESLEDLRSVRLYHILSEVSVSGLVTATRVRDKDEVVVTPIGAQVQVGTRVDENDPFEMEDAVIAPPIDDHQLLGYGQVPTFVDDLPVPQGMNMLYDRPLTVQDIVQSRLNTEKNTEMVLAVQASDLINDIIVDQGTSHIPNFIEGSVYTNLSYVRREWCETDPRFMQLLPYVVLFKRMAGEIHVFVYQRGKESAEGRIAGQCSIGVGGHINPHDFLTIVRRPGQSDDKDARVMVEGFWKGILNNIERELDEEVSILGPQRRHGIMEILQKQQAPHMSMEQFIQSKTVFFSDYQANAVEKVHLGMFMAIEVPCDVNVVTNEQLLHDVGFMPVSALVGPGALGLECWSKSIVDSLAMTVEQNSKMDLSWYTNSSVTDARIANGHHAITPEQLKEIPHEKRWGTGTLASIFDRRYKYYAMNTFVRA